MKNKIVKTLFVLFSVTLVACLDDEKYALDPEGYQNVIEFLDPSVPVSQVGSVYPVWLTAFTVSPESTLTQKISFSGPQNNDQDIVLELAVDPLALDEYNEQMVNGLNGAAPLGGITYELLPEANYSIPNLTVTIPKGQKEAEISITIFPSQFDLSKTYALPLRIVSASTGILSRHYSVAILATVVKNKYDGIYSVEPPDGFAGLTHTNPNFSGLYPKTIELRTVNGNTVVYYDHDYDFAFHLFLNGATLTYFGNYRAQFQFNETTNQVTSMVNALGQGTGNRFGKLDPSQPSPPVMTFEADGVTPKQMEIWYNLDQPTLGTTLGTFREVYTYLRPRD